MSFKPTNINYQFIKISIDDFIYKYKLGNPNEDLKKLKEGLHYFRQLKNDGATCDCGNPIWVIGSAISGKACFTCVTGETNGSEDYEIK